MKAIKLLLLLVSIGAATAAGFVYSGTYAIGADQPHWPATEHIIETLRDRSITAAAREVRPPSDLGDVARIRRGAGNYDAMCTGCHLKPGQMDSEIRKGLYPQPPDLTQSTDDGDPLGSAPARFWVIKHGIKMTAMPAWSLGGVVDDAIWDMVALLQKLPEMDARAYSELVEASDGHRHAGADAEAPSVHKDAPGTPAHAHGSAKPATDRHDHSH